MFEVTEDWVKAFQSGNGGWNRAQLECIGINWPPRQGWIKRAVGRKISDEQRQQFEALRGRTLSVLRRENRHNHSGPVPTKPAGNTESQSAQTAPDAPTGSAETVPLGNQ